MHYSSIVVMLSPSFVCLFLAAPVFLYYITMGYSLLSSERPVVDTLDCSTVNTTMISFLSQKACNKTILLMIVDYGYLDMWNNTYIAGNLSHYDNLAVFCMDRESYSV